MFTSPSFVSFVGIYLLVFGVLTLAGGVLGYVRAKSRASLIAGGVCGVLLILCGYFVDHPIDRALSTHNAIRSGFIVSLVLGFRFFRVYRASRKPMPALPILALSAIGVVVTLGPLLSGV